MDNRNRLTASLILIISLILMFSTVAFANSGFKPVDAVSAAGGSSVVPGNPKPGGGGGVWNSNYQGFRIAVLDHAGVPAFTFADKEYLDLVFTTDNIDEMDYFGDGLKTALDINFLDSSEDIKGTIMSISGMRTRLDDGRWSTSVPEPSKLKEAISKLSTSNIKRPLTTLGSGSNLSWVTNGEAIKARFYGKEDSLNEDALLYVILNLRQNSGTVAKWLWQPKNNPYLTDKPFTAVELASLKNGEITAIELMASRGLIVSVEPIIWNKLRLSQNQYSYGVYGTQSNVGGIIEWLEGGGWFKPTYGKDIGGYDASLFGRAGRRSMITADGSIYFTAYIKEDGNLVKNHRWAIDPVIDNKQNITNREVFNMQPGWSLHLYQLRGNPDDTTTTFDTPEGNTPHPAPEPVPSKLKNPTDAVINIVKTYEEDGQHVGTYKRTQNPRIINIVDEIDYKVDEWFISQDYINPSNSITWSSIKSGTSSSSSGSSPQTVKVESPNTTLYVKLTKKLTPVVTAGNLDLTESQVSKAISSMDSSIANWGPRTFTFSYGSMSGSHTHYCGGCQTDEDGEDYCPGHSCTARFGDSAFRYIIENSATIDDMLEANKAGGVFEAKMVNNIKSGAASLGGGSERLDRAEYQTVIWRGLDIPTIASYKENGSIPLKGLLNKYSKAPVGNRGTNGVYKRNLMIQLSVSSDSDLDTHSVHSFTGGVYTAVQHTYGNVNSHPGQVNVHVYRGDNKKSVGNDTNKNEIQTTTPFGGTSSIHSAGHMVQTNTPIRFYPYLRMTYMTTGSNVKTPVNIVSQFTSEILPNDFAEAAWYNSNENESLAMSSTQWSLHAKAIDSSKPWGGRNQVLPGGAIYQLSTKANNTQVSLVTWQTIIEPHIRNMLNNTLPSNEYTVAKATTEHDKYVNEAKEVLDKLRIVQWVNSNPSASAAWDSTGSSVKITGGGQSLSALGLSGSTSTEGKYRLTEDSAKNAANEGDLDIISESSSQDTFFKVFAAPDGKVYMAKSVGNLNALQNINGTNPVGGGSVTVTQILAKSDGYANVDSKLTGEAKQLNDRTKVVSNLVKALERNTGNDVEASWAPDGKWYNEAFDGIVVVRKATNLTVGLGNPGVRSAALDPKLTPPSSGQSDMFSKGFLSQFRLNEKSDHATAKNKGNGFIGTFKGKDIRLPNMESMYKSKRFFVPNVNVQDLR